MSERRSSFFSSHNVIRIFKKWRLPKISLFIIPIGVALFIAGTFSENRYVQSMGIAISVGFEMLNRIISMRRTSYEYLTDYHKHSKDIVKIIKMGFGEDSGVLGNCSDNNGIINIQTPKEPAIEDIGLGRNHLQYGYPVSWALRERAISESKETLGDTQVVKDNFESYIVNEMKRKTEKTGTTLVRKDDYESSKDELFQACYYDDLVNELFYEIKERKQGKRPRQLSAGFDFLIDEVIERGGSLYKLSFGETGKVLVRVKEADVKLRIEKLLHDPYLNSMVCRYIELKKSLDKNKNWNEYFQKIENLHTSIISEGESLNKMGKCKLCPLEPY
jgi:hypothetical protein